MDIIVATLNGVFMCKLYDRKQQCLLSGRDIYKTYQLKEGDEFLEEGIVIRSVRNHRQSTKLTKCLR
jgi:DNA polymerase V